MNRQNFKDQYNFLKELFEEIDPAGIGAKNEYDDLIFKIIKKNKKITDRSIFAQNMTDIIMDQYKVAREETLNSSKEMASRFLDHFPHGL